MNKTVFITGTNSGFGRATVELFADRGWNVIATMRRVEFAHLFAHQANVRVLQLDLNNEASMSSVAMQAINVWGQIDVLVNNAGYFQMGPLETSTMAQIRAQFDTNVFGLIALTKALLPHFRARGAGMIINVASLSAEQGYPFAVAYAASKGAVAVLTEALHLELDGLGIGVKAILPGQHATDIFTKIDAAASIPDADQPLWRTFTAQQGAVRGSQPISDRRLALADWTILITNVPPEQLSIEEAVVLLRARWQIELLFKLWKSHGKIDEWRSTKPWRILCEVYAKLIPMVIQHWLLLLSSWAYVNRSLTKAAQTVRAHARHLASVLVSRRQLATALATIVRCLVRSGRMNTRKTKPNTYQLLLDVPALTTIA